MSSLNRFQNKSYFVSCFVMFAFGEVTVLPFNDSGFFSHQITS